MSLLRNDFVFALFVTAIGIAVSQFLSLGLPATGIDDAAISMSYAENIANGHGYVYNIGGERVEGSTSFLWTCILTLAFYFFSSPNMAILLITATLTFIAVWSALGITRQLALAVDAPEDSSVWVAGIAMLGAPGFFLWSTWSQMEVGLWSGLLLFFVYQLVLMLNVEGYPSPNRLGVTLVACLLPLVRPEGVAVTIGLLAVSALVGAGHRRQFFLPAIAAVMSFSALLIFRILYFGQPWPNTFYAKVSADRLQTFVDGAKYVLSFLLQMPFVEIYVGLWVLVTLWALLSSWDKGRCFFPPAATVGGFCLCYAALGGDHFALWRFLQPLTPLLAVPAALIFGQLIQLTLQRSDAIARSAAARILLVGIGIMVAVLPGWMHYHQKRFDVIKEYRIAQRGVAFGTVLDQFSPKPVIGVGPAGGIALGYNGEILDLLGLNWTEMAHANPIKTGTRNLASFDPDVFWNRQPDIVAEFKRACEGGGFKLWSAADYFKGLYWSPQFQQAYKPVLIRKDQECWPVFIKNDWSGQTNQADIEEIPWNKVQLN